MNVNENEQYVLNIKKWNILKGSEKQLKTRINTLLQNVSLVFR